MYHFENQAIAAMKSDIVIFIHVKSIKVTSGFNLRIMKKIRQVALSYRKLKIKYQKADISTIDVPKGQGARGVKKIDTETVVQRLLKR